MNRSVTVVVAVVVVVVDDDDVVFLVDNALDVFVVFVVAVHVSLYQHHNLVVLVVAVDNVDDVLL